MERTARTADLGKWLLVTNTTDYARVQSQTDEVLCELGKLLMEGERDVMEGVGMPRRTDRSVEDQQYIDNMRRIKESLPDMAGDEGLMVAQGAGRQGENHETNELVTATERTQQSYAAKVRIQRTQEEVTFRQSQGSVGARAGTMKEQGSNKREEWDLDRSIREMDAVIKRQEEEAKRLQDVKKGVETTQKEFEKMKSFMATQSKAMKTLQAKTQEHTELIAQTNGVVRWIYNEMQVGKGIFDEDKFHSPGGVKREIQKGVSQTVGDWKMDTPGSESAKGDNWYMNKISPEMPHRDTESTDL